MQRWTFRRLRDKATRDLGSKKKRNRASERNGNNDAEETCYYDWEDYKMAENATKRDDEVRQVAGVIWSNLMINFLICFPLVSAFIIF